MRTTENQKTTKTTTGTMTIHFQNQLDYLENASKKRKASLPKKRGNMDFSHSVPFFILLSYHIYFHLTVKTGLHNPLLNFTIQFQRFFTTELQHTFHHCIFNLYFIPNTNLLSIQDRLHQCTVLKKLYQWFFSIDFSMYSFVQHITIL